MDRIRIAIESRYDGPGAALVEWTFDPAGVELILTPSPMPRAGRWQAFRAGYADAIARRPVVQAKPAAPPRPSFPRVAVALAWLALR
jgi:hypothetical protein